MLESILKLEEEAFQYVPHSRFDTFPQEYIFAKVLEEVVSAAEICGFKLQRPVIWAEDSDMGAGPAAIPSSGEHLLFAGAGTSAFCNYWAKVIAELATSLAENPPSREFSLEVAISHIRVYPDRVLLIPLQLALRYAYIGTVLGFGSVTETSRTVEAYRISALMAMEVFIVAHEYAHFLLEENPEIDLGISLSEAGNLSQQLELKCDRVATMISRAYGANRNNWMASILGGALVFFVAIEICMDARQLVGGRTDSLGDSHPQFDERLANLVGSLLLLLDSSEKKLATQDCSYLLTMLQALHQCVISDVTEIAQRWADPTDGAVGR